MLLHRILRKGKRYLKHLRVYYGATLLDERELAQKNNKIILEYYGVKRYTLNKVKLKKFYGITVVKKKYEEDKVKFEIKSVKKISTSENKIKNIIETLKTYKVTPIALNDVLTDLLKTPEFQEN